MTNDPPRYHPIEDHGAIGDLSTVALVSTDGTIDFLCFPEFDSPTIFAALLDADRGGRFRIAPVLERADHRQLYLPDSMVLLTRFLSAEGVAEVSDLMPIEQGDGIAHSVVRRAKTVRGEVRFRMTCEPRFDYARATHTVERRDEGRVVFRSAGPDAMALVLRSSVPLTIRGGDAAAEFTLRADETAEFVLELSTDSDETICGRENYASEAFKRTLNFWRAWVARSTYRGRWREMMNRSAMVLKLLSSQRHGSLVAAPTFGLPEVIGGERNWDYRYTWIRDAAFMLNALSLLGHNDEARAFARWLTERCLGDDDGQLQVLYGIDGSRTLDERELQHLDGYRGSRPVRIGNGAHDQLQLDIYGELMDAVDLLDKFGEPIYVDLWTQLKRHLAWLAENWKQPDEGVWEARGGRRHFLYSRVMCWVAFDRALRIAQRRSLPAPVDAWRCVRDAIHGDVMSCFWSDDLAAFVQSPGATTLDASALVMPLVRFISPTDPKWLTTLARIREQLVEDALVHRYRLDGGFPDGLAGTEGTFSLCSFWYVECLARAGDAQQARLAFEKMLGYANHLGLYAEELGASGEHLGNFPQAFAHIGLISSAYDLNRRLEAAGEGA